MHPVSIRNQDFSKQQWCMIPFKLAPGGEPGDLVVPDPE